MASAATCVRSADMQGQPLSSDGGVASTLPADPPAIVSVNTRGGTSGNTVGKVIFVVVVFALLMIGLLVGLNRWRASNHAKEAVLAQSSKNENKPAQVGVRRSFDVDAPPPLPASAARTASAATSALASPCADGSPGTTLIGPDGTAMVAPSGAAMRVCRDGKVLVPAIAEGRGHESAPPPLGVRTNPPGGQPGATPPPSRYAGDVMVASGGSAGAPMPAQTGPATSPMQTLQMMQSLLERGGQPGAATVQPAGGAAPPTAAAPSGASPPGSIGSLLTPSQTPMVQAAMLGDRSLLLPKGRTVDCSLSTRIISDIAGMATCVLSSNVYSDNGRVVLLERGSEAVGEYSATLTQGQRRLFVLWTRVKTPQGVVINLNSPAADALGTSGLEGFVDNHWWERVGAAFMLSLVQDAIAYKTAEATGGGGAQGTAVFQNSSQTGNRLAEKILDSTINIKPTIYKNQGDRATIFVARDLDFGTVYALRTR